MSEATTTGAADANAAARVAVIGAGPGGLVAAKWLRECGFDPVVFEASDGLGGQWNVGAAHSGVWPDMRTNTSRVLTRFADLDHAPGTPVYPKGEDVQRYLHRYAERFGIAGRVRLQTRVESVEHHPDGGWLLQSTGPQGRQQERFARVVVASGRYRAPRTPCVPGLRSFAGIGSIAHTFSYRDPGRYRGLSVLVVGGSISALEVASDLALRGVRVVTAMRRQRYILQKLLAGVPADHLAFTRFAAQAEAALPPEAIGAALRDLILSTSGRPDQYGALPPADDVFAAGIAQSQHYLPLVAEGRIVPKPWIAAVEGRTIRFADGSTETIDAILFGTGFALQLPFLSDRIRAALDLDDRHIDLHAATFHPDLDGLAFLGLFEQVGPYFPVLELQARWIAYGWSGRCRMSARTEMLADIAALRARRGLPQEVPMHRMAVRFARQAGVEPEPGAWPELARALWFGPLSPAQFRLTGPDRLADAAAQVQADAASFGAIVSAEPTAREVAQLAALAAAQQAIARAGAA